MALHLRDLFDMDLFHEMYESGFIKVQRHPKFPHDLAIANYTQKAQSNYHWNEVTEQCRGLIYNPETTAIVARPFRKFYNHDEEQAHRFSDDENVTAYDKLDGSLGIIYRDPDGVLNVATRGSFTSEQAIAGTQILQKSLYEHKLYYAYSKQYTDLVEIIYPENRIVVDYGREEKLVYLGSIHTRTGNFVWQPDYGPSTHHAAKLFKGPYRDVFKLPERKGMEGLVISGEGGRVKVKQVDYVALHRIVTRLNKRTVWEHMNGPTGEVESLVSNLPEEHAQWVRDVRDELFASYMELYLYVSETAMGRVNPKTMTRKEMALEIADEPSWCKSSIFMSLDNRDFTPVLWKQIKPAGE